MSKSNTKRVVISVGPIPARVDSVKFITNRFKGGLALKTAERLLNEPGFELTIVAWKHTDIPAGIADRCEKVVQVLDVFEYFDWFTAHAKGYDAFVMAAAVANLTPVKPFVGKFPSHLYKPGEEFEIKFMIAPRAIDAIKQLNPRACLIGYKLFDAPDDKTLTDIAKHTLDDSRANLIFANTPATAKERKLALTQDGSVIPCSFDEHCDLIVRAIQQAYYRTAIEPLLPEELVDPDIQEALATVENFENSFSKYGTVAVAVDGRPGMFATTSRGHKGEPVLVRSIDHEDRVVRASSKATLNAPAMSVALQENMKRRPDHRIAVHRHGPIPLNLLSDGWIATPHSESDGPSAYVFPGTTDEVKFVRDAMTGMPCLGVYEPWHGYIAGRTVGPVDWTKYYEQFPDRYFSIPGTIARVLDRFPKEEYDTIEIGGNDGAKTRADQVTGTAWRYVPKFAYDPYVEQSSATNLSLPGVLARRFDLGYALNAINYIDMDVLRDILAHCDAFIANTFLEAPEKSVRENESAILDHEDDVILHTLRLPDDNIVRHTFHAYGKADYEALGLTVRPYGKNSALVYKNLDLT